ncbi:MAG: thiamine transport system permease protein [Anaerolineaceae bacterium]|nr:MAG: thiamine transport system permease protein [Anaerolineaceae bacterium]
MNESANERVSESANQRPGNPPNRSSADSPNRRIVDSLIRLAPWLGVSAFLGVFFFYPIARILALSLDLSALTADNFALTFSVLRFTFYQAFLSTLLTLALGLPAAFLFARFDFRGKAFLRTLTAIPFMLPTVVVAAGFNAWLGPRGWLNLALMRLFGLESPPVIFVGTLGAILLAHVFYNTTIVVRMAGNALAHLDPRLDQAARSLGADPPRLFWRVTLPLLRPSLLAAALLVFLFDFTSFGVVLLLGGSRFATLEVETYLQAVRFFNLPLAAWLSLIQLLCTLVFSILYSRLVPRAAASAPRPAVSNLRRARAWSQRLFVSSFCVLLFAFYFLPLASLPFRSVARLEADLGQRGQIHYGLTANYYTELFVNRTGSLFYVPPVRALGNSLGYAALTVILSLALGFPAAAALARPRRLERILDPFLMLPLGASAVTLGLGFIVSFGRMLASPWMVPLAHTLIALPFVIRSLQPALASIPDRLRQAAGSLGASPVRAWFAVDWPIVRRATLAAAVFAFTVSLGEFGATALVSRPEYPTLPVAIYRFLSQPGGLNYGQAMAMATVLMLVCGAGILLIEKLRFPGAGEF